MRVCIVYDHLYPATIGGGERWLHDLALALAGAGHDVTYATMTHWRGAPPTLPGVRVVGLTGAGEVYASERRTLGAPLRFGLAVWRHLLRHGASYDVVHSGSFPYFPLLAAASLRRARGYVVVADWFEVWSRPYWRRYAGALTGTAGWLVQRLCIRVGQHAFCNSAQTARRLRAEGYRGPLDMLPGLYAGPVVPTPNGDVEPLVVFAGRHVPEKRVPLLVRGFAEAHAVRPELRLELFGDGTDARAVDREVTRLGLTDVVVRHGRRPQDEVEDAMGRARCLATASEREGYGLVVVEAAARGTPSVVVAGEENAATDLVHEGLNGAIAEAATPVAIAAAILRVVDGGEALRDSTCAWFADNAGMLRLDRSLELVVARYASLIETIAADW